MQPTEIDIAIIRLLEPFQRDALTVDAMRFLANSPFVNGLIFALPWFLFWHFSESGRRWLAQYLILTTILATGLAVFASLILQQVMGWPSPAANPLLRDVFALAFQENANPNSFPSDSTILFSVTAIGVMPWNRRLSMALLVFLMSVTAPARVFVGGHYPSDILAGLLIGLLSFALARYCVNRSTVVGALASSSVLLLQGFLFLWLFEVGNGFRDFRDLVNAVTHIQRHF